MRERFRICKLCGEMHSLSAWPDNHRELPPQRSSLPAPYFISDQLDDLVNPVDSRRYDSKTAFRRATKAGGGIEIGNDEQKDLRYYDTVTPDEVAQAYHMVEQGYVPRPETATAADMESIVP